MKISDIKKIYYSGLAHVFGPRIVAWIVYKTILKKQINVKKKYHLILCSRNIFSKDINEIMKHVEEFNFVILSNSILGSVQSAWIPKIAQEQTFYYNHLPKNSRKWKKCKLFANTIIALLEKEIKVSGIVSSNFDYWQDAGFREICRDGRSHFIVLRRENEVTNASIEKDLYDRYKLVDIGYIHLVMVFSEICKNSMKNIESEKLIFNNIVVTGPPRLDTVKEYINRDDQTTRNRLVLFTYTNGDYGEGGKNFWQVFEVLLNFCVNNKYNLLVKCKSKNDQNLIKKEIEKRAFDQTYLEIKTDISNPEAVKGALCAVSYGSTVLSELLTLPINIIVPFINVGEFELNDAILHDAGNYPDSGVYKVTSYNEMKEILILLKNNSIEYSFEQRNQLRDRYLSWNSEKLSSHRVADTIKKYCIENQ